MTDQNSAFPPNAFLIVDGADIIPLTKEINNIGRMDDNDIVIPNAHISRYHAQVRGIDGNFVLIDLTSTSGTTVNGTRIRSKVLAPGDIIMMAGVPLIYGQTSGPDKFKNPEPDPAARPSGSRKEKPGITQEVDLSTIDHILDIMDITEEPKETPDDNREN